MKILFDFSPIKTGGGAQLALNFIDYLKEFGSFEDYGFLVSDKFPFIERLPDIDVTVFPSNYVKRVFFEHLFLKNIVNKKSYSHIYTFFGPGLPYIKNVRQVVSVAYPIICYDESPYWKNLKKTEFLGKKIINYFRKNRLKKADHLIFETEVMQKRCIDVLQLDENLTTVIPPSPTSFLSDREFFHTKNKIFKFLLLSGLDNHKNIWRLIDVVNRANEEKISFKIVISCTRDLFYKKFNVKKYEFNKNIVDNYFIFTGPIPQDSIQEVYDEVDAVLNISDLESFSNNYMEAWRTAKPILASDRDFSRCICRSSAIYCEPHNIESLYNCIKKFVENSYDFDKMAQFGKSYLSELPNLEEKIQKLKMVLCI